MSRLQAPGFSRLKGPGFAKSSIPAPASAPVENGTEVPPVRSGVARLAGSQTKNSLIAKPPPVASTQHGPSPYDRAPKPQSSQIPYVGKKRITGALKAPESRKPPSRSQSDKENNAGDKAPVKRQLVMNNAKSETAGKPRVGLTQPRSANRQATSGLLSRQVELKPPPASGLRQPESKINPPKQKTTAATNTVEKPDEPASRPVKTGLRQPGTSGIQKPTSALPPKSHNRTKSLQTLSVTPTKEKPPKQPAAMNKSLSQNDLTNPNNNTQSKLKPRKFVSTTSLSKKSNLPPKFGFGGGGLRPRISTLNTDTSISTPHHTTKPSKQFDDLIISPIVTNQKFSDSESTFNAADSRTIKDCNTTEVFDKPSSVNETHVIELSQEESPAITLNQTKCIGKSVPANLTYAQDDDLILDENSNQMLQPTNLTVNLTTCIDGNDVNDVNETRCVQTNNINETIDIAPQPVNATQTIGFETYNFDNNSVGLIDETNAISNNTNTFNQTKIITAPEKLNSENEFLANQSMPNEFLMDTLNKSFEGLLSSDEANNQSFSDDIEKVIAAIGSKPQEVAPTNTVSSATPVKCATTTESMSQNLVVVSSVENMNESDFDIIDLPPVLERTEGELDSFNAFKQVDNVTSNVDNNNRTIEVDEKPPHEAVSKQKETSELENCETNGLDNVHLSEELNDELADITEVNLNNSVHPETLPLPADSSDEEEETKSTHALTLPIAIETPKKKKYASEGDSFTSSSLVTPTEEYVLEHRCHTISLGEVKRPALYARLKRSQTYNSQDFTANFRPPREMQVLETGEGNILMDNPTFMHFTNDMKSLKTQLLRLKRTLLEAECPSPLIKTASSGKPSSFHTEASNIAPLSPRVGQFSPMAVVDPLVVSNQPNNEQRSSNIPKTIEDDDDLVSLTQKFHQSLQRIEELERDSDCKANTIKLLQIQLENYESKEQDILEENIILREEVAHLNERMKRIQEIHGNENLLASASFDDYEVPDLASRKTVLHRLYSHESE